MSHLFSKGKIGNLILKNRIIMTAVHTGFPAAHETAFLERRAAGGAAAVTAVMGVSKAGAYRNMCVLEPDHKDDLVRMVEAVHGKSGKLFVQLFHAGRNAAVGMLADPAATPVAPSSIPSPIYKEIPRELTESEIADILREFGRAAALCREAGVDGVEISCSAGYLLSQFFSPRTNQRADAYGGSFENRMKFPLAVISEVRAAVGDDYPVILRVSAGDMLGGYGVADTIALVRKAEDDIDAVNVTGGWHESEIPQISMFLPEGGFAFLAWELKKQLSIPVIACNRINNGETAKEIVEKGYADFAGCARAFLADSDFAKKVEKGVPYRRCIGCNKGCIEKVLKLQAASCIFNPETGNEMDPIPEREHGRRVLVIGGGPAGIEAALRCAKQGDDVELCTDEPMLGGHLHAASKAPYKETIARNLKAMRAEMESLRIKINCSVLVDPAYILKANPDYLIAAMGSKPVIPPIPGINQSHVYLARQVLTASDGPAMVLRKGKVLILGGGSVGLETALSLVKKPAFREVGERVFEKYADDAMKEGLCCSPEITVVEMSGKAGADLGGLRRAMLNELKHCGVELITNARVEEIGEKGVVLDIGGILQTMEADVVILAAGYRPQGQALLDWLEKTEKFPYCVIGDANGIGNIGKALREAYEAAK